MEKLLREIKCVGCEGGISSISAERIKDLHQQIPEWKISADQKARVRRNGRSVLGQGRRPAWV